MEFDELIDDLARRGSNDELLKSLESDKDFPPPISKDEVEDTPTKGEDGVKEEEELRQHDNVAGEFEDNPIKVKTRKVRMVNSTKGMGFGMIMRVVLKRMTLILSMCLMKNHIRE